MRKSSFLKYSPLAIVLSVLSLPGIVSAAAPNPLLAAKQARRTATQTTQLHAQVRLGEKHSMPTKMAPIAKTKGLYSTPGTPNEPGVVCLAVDLSDSMFLRQMNLGTGQNGQPRQISLAGLACGGINKGLTEVLMQDLSSSGTAENPFKGNVKIALMAMGGKANGQGQEQSPLVMPLLGKKFVYTTAELMNLVKDQRIDDAGNVTYIFVEEKDLPRMGATPILGAAAKAQRIFQEHLMKDAPAGIFSYFADGEQNLPFVKTADFVSGMRLVSESASNVDGPGIIIPIQVLPQEVMAASANGKSNLWFPSKAEIMSFPDQITIPYLYDTTKTVDVPNFTKANGLAASTVPDAWIPRMNAVLGPGQEIKPGSQLFVANHNAAEAIAKILATSSSVVGGSAAPVQQDIGRY